MNGQSAYKLLLIPVFVSALLILSCEDVIQVNLRNAAPRIVIEGSISNLSDSVIIQLHRSTDYFTPTAITPVNDAIVSVTDSAGTEHSLFNIRDGVYAGVNIKSKPGDVFTLSVADAGVNYTASATMPILVQIQSLFIDKNPDRPDEDRVNILIDDPAGIANYYKVDVFRNDSILNGGNHFILFTDKYFDGKNNYLQISGRRLDIKSFTPGDRVKVRLLNIEKIMYDYFDIERSITDAGQILSVSTPSNPPNNIDNGAMGYFGVWSVSERTVIVN